VTYLSRLRTRRCTPPAAFRRKTTLGRPSVYYPSVCPRARARARSRVTYIYIRTCVRARSRDFHWRWLLRSVVADADHRGASVSRGLKSFRAHISVYTFIRACTHRYIYATHTHASLSLIHFHERFAHSLRLPTTTRELLLLSVLAYPVPSRFSTVEEKEEKAATVPRYTTADSP